MKTSVIKMALVLVLGCFPLLNCGSEIDETDETITNPDDGKGDYSGYGSWASTPEKFLQDNAQEGAIMCYGGISRTRSGCLAIGCATGYRCSLHDNTWSGEVWCCHKDNPNAVQLGSTQNGQGEKQPVCLSRFGCK